MNRRAARSAIDEVVAEAHDASWSTAETLVAVARAVAENVGATAPALPEFDAGVRDVQVRRELVARHATAFGPELLGGIYERLLHPHTRRRQGVHFTPRDVALALVAFTLDGLAVDPHHVTVCDPACGGGAFLLAAAEVLHERGAPREVAARAMHGTDIDPLAVWVAATSLDLWARGADAASRVRCADALDDDVWGALRFDVVIGNPPFQNQMQTLTTRSRDAYDRAIERLGGRRAAYVDTAALFLVRGLELVRDGGRVALVQPHSTLAARDAAAVRARVHTAGVLDALWYTTESIFDASVRVCAPVLERGHPAPQRPVRRALGRDFAPAAPFAHQPDAASWGPLVSDLLGVPAVQLDRSRRVGDIATAKAAFRDQYYGLVGAVHDAEHRAAVALDAPAPPRLCTSGLIDAVTLSWGAKPAKFARTRYAAPVVDLDALDDRTAAWVRGQLVPKLLVATQSKVIEAAVDVDGCYVACTPVIAVVTPPERLWHVAAALSAPCVSAHAFAQVAGTALSAGALKLSARQVVELPLPLDAAAWDEGAQLAAALHHAGPAAAERTALLDDLGATMQRAYRCTDPAVLSWWRSRIGQ